MKKILYALAILFFLVFAGGFFFIRHLKKSALPDYNAKVSLKGLQAPVEVWRDSLGIPHIYAQNEHDLYMVTGYLEAQDRMWQMDLVRRVTQGRLSEIFGEKALEADKLLRKLQIPKTSQAWWNHMDDQMKNRIRAYADGINAYLKDAGDKLPLEFKILNYTPEPWELEHSLNLVGYMAWMLETGYKTEAFVTRIKQTLGDKYLEDILPDWSGENDITVYTDFSYPAVQTDTALTHAMAFIREIAPEISNGSNNWAVSGKKSVTGKPLFSNDMHLHLALPGIWWRAHQVVEGQLNVTGVLLPGSPFIVAGHNEHIAWGMTNVMLDGADFYVEKIDTVKKAYFFNGEWKPLRVKEEIIRVKGKEKPVVVPMYYTHRGPVLTQIGKVDVTPVSMKWVGNNPDSREIEALYGFNHAKNWEEFRKAAAGFRAVSQNIAYADTQGNIGIQCTGSVPVRTAPGYFFYPGQTDMYDWKGFIPFDSLPFEYNPARGYISSANNKTFDEKLYVTEWYDLPYRIIRIRQMLESKEKFSPEDFREMLNDHLSVRAQRLLPLLLDVLDAMKTNTPLDEKVLAAISMLENWDTRYEKNAKAPLLFEEFMRQWVRNVMADEMDEQLFRVFYGSFLLHKYPTDNIFRDTTSVWVDNVKTKKKESFSEMVMLSLRQALDTLDAKYGKWDKKSWGEVHRLHLEHPLGKVKLLDRLFGLNRDLDAPGSTNTVNPFSFYLDHPYNSDFGASEKHIFNTADWDASYSILPAGESGMPGSPHYLDQAKAYVEGKVFPDRFSREKVEKHARYKTTFTPAP